MLGQNQRGRFCLMESSMPCLDDSQVLWHVDQTFQGQITMQGVHSMHRPCDAARAKYVLAATQRTHMASSDEAYGCMGEGEDGEGLKGVFLRKNVVETCEAALRINLAALLPRLVPWHVQVRCRKDIEADSKLSPQC